MRWTAGCLQLMDSCTNAFEEEPHRLAVLRSDVARALDVSAKQTEPALPSGSQAGQHNGESRACAVVHQPQKEHVVLSSQGISNCESETVSSWAVHR